MTWYLIVLKKYAVFEGRARRKEYWMFVLFNIIFSIAAMVLDGLVGAATGTSLPIFYLAYCLAIILPALGVSVRRLHDAGKSGWFLLVSLIPLIGGIWLLIVLCSESQAAENEYGPSPKAGLALA